VFARDEEGSPRPNLGIRALNPRAEQGAAARGRHPARLRTYGDNASYYHPRWTASTASRFLKGSGQILFGPHTVAASSTTHAARAR